jgi:hypothetical protein
VISALVWVSQTPASIVFTHGAWMALVIDGVTRAELAAR